MQGQLVDAVQAAQLRGKCARDLVVGKVGNGQVGPSRVGGVRDGPDEVIARQREVRDPCQATRHTVHVLVTRVVAANAVPDVADLAWVAVSPVGVLCPGQAIRGLEEGFEGRVLLGPNDPQRRGPIKRGGWRLR